MKAFGKLILAFSFFANSCKEPVITGVVIDTQVNLIVKDKAGQNLLNPSVANHYTADEIRLFYLKDGQKTDVYAPNQGYPRNFFIAQNETNKEYYIRVFLDLGTTNQELTTTYIRWRANQEDTIQGLMTRQGVSVYADKVWYNSVLKYDVSTNALDTDWGEGRFRRLIEISK